jgi:hypothetical protein
MAPLGPSCGGKERSRKGWRPDAGNFQGGRQVAGAFKSNKRLKFEVQLLFFKTFLFSFLMKIIKKLIVIIYK